MKLKVALHRLWAPYALRLGHPLSSPQLPRPSLDPRRRRMRLSHVLLACDSNPAYLEFWPLVRRAWEEIVELEPILLLVAGEHEVPSDVLDGSVIRFSPLPDVHRTLQAQCIRLLYPALVPADGAVIISDIDLLPVRRSYFHAPIAQLDDRFFVVYRDVLLPRREVMMPYNAARPETWAEIFGIAGVDDVAERLRQWARDAEYDGVRGGSGWYTDQRTLYRTLFEWDKTSGRLWVLDDAASGYHRLGRQRLESRRELTPREERRLRTGRYSDCDWVIPYRDHEDLNLRLLELALANARRSPAHRGEGERVQAPS